MTPGFIAILGAAESSVVLAIVLIISVISWIVNLIQGNGPKGRVNPQPRQNSSDKSELERFLREVVGDKPAENERKRQGAKRSGAEKKKQKTQQQASRPPAQPQRLTDRPGARLAQTHLAPLSVADSTRPPIGSQLEISRFDNTVNRDVSGAVERDINSAVIRDIGADGTVINSQRPEHPLIQALRNPQGVRQAVILSEILERPKRSR